MKLSSGLAAAALAGLVALPAFAATVTDTLDFGTQANGNAINYLEDGYKIDIARIVNGNCDSDSFVGGSGPACAALNQNESMTISRTDGGTFDLTSFWFELFGGGARLDLVVKSDLGGLITFLASAWGNKDGYVYDVTDPLFWGISSLTFEGTTRGNRRIDDIGLSHTVAAVPLPAGGLLLIAGLGGLAAFRRKRTTA